PPGRRPDRSRNRRSPPAAPARRAALRPRRRGERRPRLPDRRLHGLQMGDRRPSLPAGRAAVARHPTSRRAPLCRNRRREGPPLRRRRSDDRRGNQRCTRGRPGHAHRPPDRDPPRAARARAARRSRPLALPDRRTGLRRHPPRANPPHRLPNGPRHQRRRPPPAPRGRRRRHARRTGDRPRRLRRHRRKQRRTRLPPALTTPRDGVQTIALADTDASDSRRGLAGPSLAFQALRDEMPPKSVLEIRALRTAGRPWRPWVVVAAAALAVAVGWTATPHGSGRPAARAVPVTPATSAGESPGVATRRSTLVRHYEYVFPDGGFYVYDIDRGHRLVQHVSLPQLHGIRGVGVSLQKHRLYISYGGDGGENGNGSLLAYDLQSGEVLWQRAYNTGID